MNRKSINSNVVYNKLPMILIIVGLYNILFQYIGLNYVYIYIYLVGILWSLGRRFTKPSLMDFFVLLYIMLVIISTLFFILIFHADAETPLISSLLYILPVLFWFLYYKTNRSFSFSNLIVSLKWYVFAIALLGLVQYYISPNLFGVLISTSNNIQWAIDNESYKPFFRATSILGSPQIYGAFISLYLVLYSISIKNTNSKIGIKNTSYMIFLLIAGAHSGNKSFFAVLIIYILYLLYKNKFFIQTVVLLGIVIFLINKFQDSTPFLQRIFFNEELIQSESERITIWRDAFLNLKIFGDGPGSWSNTSFNLGNEVVESYLLQILSELGVLTFISFIILIISNLLRIRNSKFWISFITCVFIMIIVHVFNNPSFILFWGVCLYGIYTDNTQSYYEKPSPNKFSS